ncbi:peptidoglycan-binding protein [Streptomyces sp. NPDC006784]|uniref:peptidoglycan-binding protein n=1 Tax=Streptomyces sp. NPDC006784 TaxID=3364764 RepID=UPI0036CD5CF5
MDSYWRFGHGGREPNGVLVPGEGSGMAGDGRCPGCGRSAAECTSADRAGCGGGAGQDGGPEAREPVPGTAREPAPADPLHIRPYVRLLGNDPVRTPGEEVPGEGRESAPADAPESSGPPPVPDARVPLPGLAPPAARDAGEDSRETAGLPNAAGPDGKGPDPAGPDGRGPDATGLGRAERPAAGGTASVRHRRMAERRRPSTAVFAGVGVAAVLGGGLLTTQLLTDDGSRAADGRALRHMPTGAPDEGPRSVTPSATPTTPQRERSEPAPSRSSAPAIPRADRDSGKHTASPSPSGGGREEASEPPGRSGGRERVRPRPEHPERPSGKTLRPGDSGVAVVELQRRLKQAGYYDLRAEEDGVYSSRVQEAVFRYQAHCRLWDDTPGVYGPATRRHLEARTSG